MAIPYERLNALEHALGGREAIQAAYALGMPLLAGWKAPVPTANDLPVENNSDGDARVALDTQIIHIWNAEGSAWQGSAVGGTTIVQDTFTGPDGTLLTAHTGEVDAGWTLHPSENTAPAPQIESGVLHRSDTSSDTCSLYASGIPMSADYSVSVDFGVIGDITGHLWYSGVWGRLDTSALTGYLMNYVANNGTIYISLTKVVAGSFTDLGTHTVLPDAHTGTLTMNGNVISVKVDGVTVMSFTDSAITAVGRVGVRFGSSSNDNTDAITLDNVVAAALS